MTTNSQPSIILRCANDFRVASRSESGSCFRGVSILILFGIFTGSCFCGNAQFDNCLRF